MKQGCSEVGSSPMSRRSHPDGMSEQCAPESTEQNGKKSRLALWKQFRAKRDSIPIKRDSAPPSSPKRQKVVETIPDATTQVCSPQAPAISSNTVASQSTLATPVCSSQPMLSQTTYATPACSSQAIVLVDDPPAESDSGQLVDGVAQEERVYEELLDLDALRWYIRSKVDSRHTQAEELLANAEKNGHCGRQGETASGIRRVPVSYRRCEDSGRRVSAGTSVQQVSRECRAAACGSILCEIDISGSFPALIVHMVDECVRHDGAPKSSLASLRCYVSTRENFINTVMRHYRVDRDAVALLVSRLLLGGTIWSWRNEVGITQSCVDIPLVVQFQTEVAASARIIAASRPDVVNHFQAKNAYSHARALAYILGCAEDAIISMCEDIMQRDDIVVSSILPAGFMVDMSTVTEEELYQVLHVARQEIRDKLRYPVVFERKLLPGCSMQARISRLGGTPCDIALAAENDMEIARLKQRQYEMMREPVCRREKRVDVACVPWTPEEKAKFATAMDTANLSDPRVFEYVARCVGRSVTECKQYYNRQKQSSSVAKKPVKKNRNRAMPKTDCALRRKCVRDHLKNRSRDNDSKNTLADCFRPQEKIIVSLEGLDDIASVPLDPGRLSTPSANSEVSCGEADSEPQNLHRYVHSMAGRSLGTARLRSRPLFGRPSCGNTLRKILREEDDIAQRQRDKEEYGSDWESDFEIQE